MRAARLLQILLLLQNRGRLTSAELATELEVAQRTIHRDIDAMTEAGLPVITHRGREGGVELGFDYRTRLTGLDRDEALAMGVVLSLPLDRLEPFGLADAGRRACAKIWEAFPDQTRALMAQSRTCFGMQAPETEPDPRCAALSDAIRRHVVVRLRLRSGAPQTVHPVALHCVADGWTVRDALSGEEIGQNDWGDINISSQEFTV